MDMRLVNYILEKLNSKIVSQFNDFKENNHSALALWLSWGKANNKNILPECESIFVWANQEIEEFNKLSYNSIDSNSNESKFNYRQKKFIVERESLIIQLYETYSHYKTENVLLEYNKLETKYPDGIKVYLTPTSYEEEFEGVKVTILIKEKIVSLGEDYIAQIDELAKDAKKKKLWMSEQDKFAQFARNVHNETFKGWGCYKYDLDISLKSYNSAKESIQKLFGGGKQFL